MSQRETKALLRPVLQDLSYKQCRELVFSYNYGIFLGVICIILEMLHCCGEVHLGPGVQLLVSSALCEGREGDLVA